MDAGAGLSQDALWEPGHEDGNQGLEANRDDHVAWQSERSRRAVSLGRAVIVRCHQIVSPATRKVLQDHPAIRVGVEYPVLEIVISADRVLLRIPDRLDTSADRDSPGLWDAAMFTVVSGEYRVVGWPGWMAGL
jgi:hypothetical protein